MAHENTVDCGPRTPSKWGHGATVRRDSSSGYKPTAPEYIKVSQVR